MILCSRLRDASHLSAHFVPQWISIPFAVNHPAVSTISPSEVDWVGYVPTEYYGQYFDYGMLLVFGGIPWQVQSSCKQST